MNPSLANHPRIGPRTAAEAFRADILRRPQLDATEEETGGWILVASMLEQGAFLSGASARHDRLEQAARFVAELVGTEEIEREWRAEAPFRHAPRAAGVVRILIDRVEEAGAFNLALAAIEALRQLVPLAVVDDGRLLAQRCRILWKQGDLDGASEGYDFVEQLGVEHDEPEIVFRARLGRLAIAHMRGNFPAVQAIAEPLARECETTFPRFAAAAHGSLMMVAAKRGDFDAGMTRAADMLRVVHHDSSLEVTVLNQVGHLLIEAGQYRGAFAVLRRALGFGMPRRFALPAAGGLALAGAFVGETAAVRDVARQILTNAMHHLLPFHTAQALFDVAVAGRVIGDDALMAEANDKVLQLAREYGFHELQFRAESLAEEADRARGRAAAASLSANATEIVTTLERLTPAPRGAGAVLAAVGV